MSSVNQKMEAIANEIRAKTGKTGLLNLDQMAASIDEIHTKAHTEGFYEGEVVGYNKGVTNEYDAFWDTFQDKGNRKNYTYAFYGEGWNSTTYKPKYKFAPNSAPYMYANALIEEIGELDFSSVPNINSVFNGCTELRKIEKFKVPNGAVSNAANTFKSCENLIETIFEGAWNPNGLSLQWSLKLNKLSITSLLNSLSSSTGGTITLSKQAVNNAFGIDIDDESTYPEGSEWYELRNSKANWSISFI